jgi:hypothetical protein
MVDTTFILVTKKNLDHNSLFIIWTSNHAPATHMYKIKKKVDDIDHFFVQLLQRILGMWQYFLLLTYQSDTEQHNLAHGGREEGV